MFRLILASLFICAVACDNQVVCKDSWKPYHDGDATENGVKIFYKFFKTHQDIKNEFPKFKDVDMDHLKENADFKAHATKIYHVIDDAVMKQNWDDVENLSTFHKNIGKTNKDQFNKFRTVFMNMVTEHDHDHTDAWNACMDKFFEHFYKHF